MHKPNFTLVFVEKRTFLFKKKNFCCAFISRWLIWLSQSNLLYKIKPKSFTQDLLVISVSSAYKWTLHWSNFFISKHIASKLAMLKSNLFSFDHLVALFTFFVAKSKFIWLPINFVTSANIYVLFAIRDGRSLIYTANIKTANTEPYGPPLVTVNSDEYSSLIYRHCVLFDKYSAKKSRNWLSNPKCRSFNKIALWFIPLNAFAISR